MIEFVSYDGEWPNLCSGTLVIRVNGVKRTLHDVLHSGGECFFTEGWQEHISRGKWMVNVPEDLVSYKKEIEAVVNENVEWGCCGGCL